MIKIAVISDVHANKLALDAILEDIENFKPDKLFCLGDLILAGYNPNYVVSKIIELKEKFKENFEIIQGNTDKMVAFCNNDMLEKTKAAFPCMGYSLEEDVKITDKKYIEFVKDLPEKKSVTINGLKIELVHGSPRNQSENIYPDMEIEKVEEMAKSSDAELILCGHTHIPCGYTLNSGKTIINAGSVGRSMTKDKMPVYLQITVDDKGQFYSEHRVIKYDIEQVKRHILARGFSHVEDLANMF